MPKRSTVPSGKGSKNPSRDAGAYLIALAGLGVVLYGVFFLIRNFTAFIELGLTAELVGATPDQIQTFSPRLFHYISHLHINFSAVVIALGLSMIALAWFGIRRGERWTLWSAVIPPLIALVIGLPVHYVRTCRCRSSRAGLPYTAGTRDRHGPLIQGTEKIT